MKYNILKTIIGSLMISMMFMSFECGEEEDNWETQECRTFCLDNHTYDTIDIQMTNTPARAARKTITSRPFSLVTISSFIIDDSLTAREAVADFLGGWDTVRLMVKGVEKAVYCAPVCDSTSGSKSFFNIDSWEFNSPLSNSWDKKYIFKVVAADLE